MGGVDAVVSVGGWWAVAVWEDSYGSFCYVSRMVTGANHSRHETRNEVAQ